MAKPYQIYARQRSFVSAELSGSSSQFITLLSDPDLTLPPKLFGLVGSGYGKISPDLVLDQNRDPTTIFLKQNNWIILKAKLHLQVNQLVNNNIAVHITHASLEKY
jgi:hypothetical protein